MSDNEPQQEMYFYTFGGSVNLMVLERPLAMMEDR